MSAIGKRQHLALTERTARNAEAKAEASSGLYHASTPKGREIHGSPVVLGQNRTAEIQSCATHVLVQLTAESAAAILMESCLARQPEHHSDSTAPRELESIVH